MRPRMLEEHRQPKKRFHWQRCQSYGRVDFNGNNILWKLTFDDWYKIWMDSGKYHLRGPHKGQYCMSRYNDVGHYEVGNVFIQLSSSNVSDARLNNSPWNKGIPVTEAAKEKMRISLAQTRKEKRLKEKQNEII